MRMLMQRSVVSGGGGGGGRGIWCSRRQLYNNKTKSLQQNYEHEQVRAFTYFDDYGKVLRNEERAFETVFILKRENELKEILRRDGPKLLMEARRAYMQILEHVQAKQMVHGELNDAKSLIQSVTLRMPSWLGVQQICHEEGP